MPKGSEELTQARKEEIIRSCAALYETTGFNDITIRDIGVGTSFTRTSIYNYFQTKEEIFLALLQQEYQCWVQDLEGLLRSSLPMDAARFSDALAATLERRGCMLKLLAMNLYDIEGNCRLENLKAFKQVYKQALETLSRCLERFFPKMTAADIQEFLYAFFPFLFGIYPYTNATEKQKQAMEQAHLDYPRYTISQIARPFIFRLLLSFA